MIGIKVPVAAEGTGWRSRAQELASRFGLPCANETENPDYLLTVNAQGLVLKQLGYRGGVYLDFVRGCSGYRTRRGGGRQQPLARAVGLRQGRSPEVLDVTAGLGRDAFVLASLGCQVVLLERSPVIAALLFDALERALADGPTWAVAARMRLHHIDALHYLDTLRPESSPEVIYLDPMYPQRRKSALVKKEMRLFRLLVGEDQDAPQLLAAARETARYRSVVKRPKGAEWIGGQKPSMEIHGPGTRYDVYVRRAFPRNVETDGC